MKLGVIIPYRKRESQLKVFKKEITEYLDSKNIEFELIVIEQSDNLPFNRGKLLNVGFDNAKKLGCNYVVFHDVDMIPVKVDYSYSDTPLHLATNFEFNPNIKRIIFDEYFGGVTMFPVEDFEKINGYSNEYWGWGFEDDDLLYRCKKYNVGCEAKPITKETIYEKGMFFNGKTSYVECNNLKNIFDFENNRTIVVSFKSDDIVSNPNKEYDDFTIFSIPGYDLNITYNSFKRYKAEVWSEKLEAHSITTDILPNTYTTIVLSLDFENDKIIMYKDGIMVEEKMIGYKYMKDGFEQFRGARIYNHPEEESFYIGCGNPIRVDNPNYFKGVVTNFAIYDGLLTELEIQSISENNIIPLTQNFKKYKSAEDLLCYYNFNLIKDDKLIDLSFNDNDATINNCHLVKLEIKSTEQIVVPKRRKSLFKLIPHKENGYIDGKWKEKGTRINQIKFFKNIENDILENIEDGLSTCKYRELTNVSEGNYHFVSVLL
jgi:hypothetical protein